MLQGLKNLKNNFIFSFTVSWNASKTILIFRLFNEIFLAIQPLLLLYLGKMLLDMIAQDINNIESVLHKLIYILVAIFVFEALLSILNRLNEIMISIHNDKISYYINVQTMEKAKVLDLAFFDSPDFYNLLQLAKRDSHALTSFSWFSITVIKSMLQVITNVIILVKLFWVFPILIIVLSIPSMLLEKKFIDHLYQWGIDRVPEERKMSYINDILTSREYAKEIRIYNVFDHLFQKYHKYWGTWFDEKIKITKKKSIWVSLVNILPQMGVTLVTVYVTVQIINKTSTIGDYSLYTGSAAQLFGAIAALVMAVSSMYDNGLRIENYKKFIALKNMNANCGDKLIDGEINIEFKEVTFVYPNTTKKILDRMSFKLDAGQRVAIVGLNGEGKSTIIKLILRFYDPDSGEVLINGHDIKEYDLVQLRKVFGVIFQDFSNYAFTLRENITITDLDQKENEVQIIKACKQAGVEKLLKKWDTGLDTYLTKQFEENGEELSGGEWQKLALARTFFKESKFIILDEPTAALDPEAEHKIYKRIASLCSDRGAIFISHRLSSVVITDRILVIKDGKVVEDGSHQELMTLGGIYYYLFNLQLEKYNIKG